MKAKGWCVLAVVAGASGGCAAMSEREDPMDALVSQVDQLETRLASTQHTLRVMTSGQQSHQDDLAGRLDALNTQLQALPAALGELCAASTQGAPTECEQSAPTRTVIMSGDKMVVGELERVWIEPPGATLIARIDTGASSSSLHAENLVEFERDGDDWVRFDLVLDDEATTLERRVERYVRVYQQADPQGTRRPVVEIRLRLGDVQNTFEFTLADRAHLEHQMILGRNFLADMALVDVGKRFVQPPFRPPKS